MTITEIFSETRGLTDSNTTSYSDTDLLRRVNSSIELLVSKIIQNCRNYPYDDENFGNIASGTITLEEGVSKYTITDKFLDILEIKVKDVNGSYHIVDPTTQAENESIMETLEAATGLPTQYRAVGRTIRLSPAPGAVYATLTAGLLFSYTRTSYQITAADLATGTLIPGIASPWHITIAKMSALPYNKLYHKDRVQQLMIDIQDEIYGKEGLLSFYANRQKDRISRLIPRVENCR